ncbi:hypothetical protein QVD17_18499 [Tagetes erecta]|uniref:Uncharacterized protein n=1 Tax=Tagetes erecta TaxID=13708 RepID=A0AAD8KKK7_TARER|nr:hypothetical protein QVD17_18499 [Tagetes erecta]
MSASQLLRILQILPACDDDQICVSNTDEPKANTNEASGCTNPFLCTEVDNQVNFWNHQPELESSTFGNEDETRIKSPARDVSPHLLANTTGFRIDKHSVECDLPELMVCYKESDFHAKDNNNNDDDDMIHASLDTAFMKHEWLRGSTFACCSMDVELSSTVPNATNICRPNYLTNTCIQRFNSGIKLQDDVFADQDSSLTPFDDDDINKHPLQGSKDEPAKKTIVGSVDIVSVVNQHDVASGYKLAMKDHDTRYVEEDSSFSMAGVISELISCSRPMPLAGGISTRSNSSAASTRSFAFPTLETEYTSSPVRMGKIERKKLHKQREWRKGLLCCNGYQLDHPARPRKLMFNNKIEGYEAKDFVSSIGHNQASTGQSYKKEVNVMMHATKGTRQEWIEGSDPTHEFFTMDYSHVRRRRPIHNKSYRETVSNSP